MALMCEISAMIKQNDMLRASVPSPSRPSDARTVVRLQPHPSRERGAG
jgi:hypothetical protein